MSQPHLAVSRSCTSLLQSHVAPIMGKQSPAPPSHTHLTHISHARVCAFVLQRRVTTLGVASGVNNLAMMQLMLSEPETDVNAVDEVRLQAALLTLLPNP